MLLQNVFFVFFFCCGWRMTYSDEGFVELPSRGSSRYLIPTRSQTYNVQRNKCLAAGGDLASVETWEEWQHIYKEVQSAIYPRYGYQAWLGGGCSDGSSYKWLTGSFLTLDIQRAFRFGENRPCRANAARVIEAHIGFSGDSVTHSWYSYPVTAGRARANAICELPA